MVVSISSNFLITEGSVPLGVLSLFKRIINKIIGVIRTTERKIANKEFKIVTIFFLFLNIKKELTKTKFFKTNRN
jgi:hypothetical protein